MTSDCLFCKIIKGEIPSRKVYENEYVLGFLDINPVNPGHTLVIPKKHCRDFLDMPHETISQIFIAAQKIAKAVKESTNAEGINIAMNIEKAAGQVIFHAHLHVMPRFSNDGHKLWNGNPYRDGQAEEIQKRILERLK